MTFVRLKIEGVGEGVFKRPVVKVFVLTNELFCGLNEISSVTLLPVIFYLLHCIVEYFYRK